MLATHILPNAIKNLPKIITISMQRSRDRIKQESKIRVTMMSFSVEHYKVKFLVAALGAYFYSSVTEKGAPDYSQVCVKALGMPSGNESLPNSVTPHRPGFALVFQNKFLPVEY